MNKSKTDNLDNHIQTPRSEPILDCTKPIPKIAPDIPPSIKQTLGSNLGIGKLKLGFWGEKCVFPELLSDSMSCFMFLRLFHTFLF
ncbi:hypothetical protein MTR_8g017360 [Medicago truncatula]|uniref:Uncharacterized protein n=1 Tax=Medicago truncatula TaxID=3880 RepID=A0A072TLN2_MEDTR|nr:hypothetical protein MTR_8g017360 [Medicago truncatula]